MFPGATAAVRAIAILMAMQKLGYMDSLLVLCGILNARPSLGSLKKYNAYCLTPTDLLPIW
jgi:hypothetical protein